MPENLDFCIKRWHFSKTWEGDSVPQPLASLPMIEWRVPDASPSFQLMQVVRTQWMLLRHPIGPTEIYSVHNMHGEEPQDRCHYGMDSFNLK